MIPPLQRLVPSHGGGGHSSNNNSGPDRMTVTKGAKMAQRNFTKGDLKTPNFGERIEGVGGAGGGLLISPSVTITHTGLIYVHLGRDPHFNNVTRRHGYSWGLSGFCEWRRGAVSFFIGLFPRKKGLLAFWEGALSPAQKALPKSQNDFISRKRTIKMTPTPTLGKFASSREYL